jgi:hypothetical protein
VVGTPASYSEVPDEISRTDYKIKINLNEFGDRMKRITFVIGLLNLFLLCNKLICNCELFVEKIKPVA